MCFLTDCWNNWYRNLCHPWASPWGPGVLNMASADDLSKAKTSAVVCSVNLRLARLRRDPSCNIRFPPALNMTPLRKGVRPVSRYAIRECTKIAIQSRG